VRTSLSARCSASRAQQKMRSALSCAAGARRGSRSPLLDTRQPGGKRVVTHRADFTRIRSYTNGGTRSGVIISTVWRTARTPDNSASYERTQTPQPSTILPEKVPPRVSKASGRDGSITIGSSLEPQRTHCHRVLPFSQWRRTSTMGQRAPKQRRGPP